MGHKNMVNMDVDIKCADSSTRRAFGYDMISRKCFQALEAYRRGNISCQIHPRDTLETFQGGELNRHGDLAASRHNSTRNSHVPGDVELINENARLTTGAKKLKSKTKHKKPATLRQTNPTIPADVKNKRFHLINGSTNRVLSFDMISRKCAQAYEVYFRGNMLCQSSRCDSLEAFQDSKLYTHDSGATCRDNKTIYSPGSGSAALINKVARLSAKANITGIAKRLRTENKQQQPERTWHSLLKNIPEVILILNRDGTILYINHAVSGYAIEETIGRTVYDLIPPEQHFKTEQAIKKVFESGEVLSFETNVIGPGGKLMWYSTRLGPISNGNEVISAAQVWTDITESKQKEEELDTFRTHMARTEWLASLGTLSATLAHEFKQPLTVVRLSLDDALDELEATSSYPDSVTKDLREALNQVSNLTSIINGFRNLVRKPQNNAASEVDVKVVADRIVKLLNESAQRKRTVLSLQEMDELPPICMNERDLEQVFFALIENAIQAADGKKVRQISVSGALRDHFVELRFSDNSGGIAPENLEDIFEPFFTTKPPGQGTGLGLCIVQEVVSRLGGKVRVKSKFGQGTTFFVTLPVSDIRMS